MEKNVPLVLLLHEAENQLLEAVNDAMLRLGLPCCLMEPMVEKIHQKLLEGKSAELQAAIQEQNKQDNESEDDAND